jgi:ESS family glutamate:Na+ symporter
VTENVFELDTLRVLLLSVGVFWLGVFINSKVSFLEKYNIPAPVTGGSICSVLVAIISVIFSVKITFDLAIRDSLLLIFFTTIGLSANISLLIAGGKSLAILLLVAIVFLFGQNLVGITVASLFEGHPAYGLLAGSVSFAGGHGTGITYGRLFESEFGLAGTMELAMACATFGLILGGVVGGPLAQRLISKHNLEIPKAEPSESDSASDGLSFTSMNGIINATFIIALCMGIGEVIHANLTSAGVNMPLYLPSLFAGVIVTNIAGLFKVKTSPAYDAANSLWGDVSLTLFLAMSLMSMQLLGLSAAMRPILIVLVLQVAIMVFFAYFVVFRVMGKDYDAAVITAGFAGLGLGATPVGMANMRAVTTKYAHSAKAFLVVPLLGAFFIDIVNAIVLQIYMESSLFGG